MLESFRFYKKIRLFTCAFKLSTNTYYCKKWSAIWQIEQRRQSQLTWNKQRFKTNRVCGKLSGFLFFRFYSVDMSEGGSYSGESLVIWEHVSSSSETSEMDICSSSIPALVDWRRSRWMAGGSNSSRHSVKF